MDNCRPEYSLIYKKDIIRELLRQVIERQQEPLPEMSWMWNQSEKCAYITVLQILENDLSCLDEETIEILNYFTDASKSIEKFSQTDKPDHLTDATRNIQNFNDNFYRLEELVELMRIAEKD